MFMTMTRFFGSASFRNAWFCRAFFALGAEIVKCLTKRHTSDLFSSPIGVSMDLQVQ
jgi:hypothetical protein